MKEYVALKLPEAFDGLRIEIWNYLDMNITFQQDKAVWNAEKKQWVVNVRLLPIDHHLKLRNGA